MSDSCGIDEQAVAQRVWLETGIGGPAWYPVEEKDLWLGYARLVLTKGAKATPSDIPDDRHRAAVIAVANDLAPLLREMEVTHGLSDR